MANKVVITEADKARMLAFVAGMRRTIQYKDGKTIKDLPARIYRQFWTAPIKK